MRVCVLCVGRILHYPPKALGKPARRQAELSRNRLPCIAGDRLSELDLAGAVGVTGNANVLSAPDVRPPLDGMVASHLGQLFTHWKTFSV